MTDNKTVEKNNIHEDVLVTNDMIKFFYDRPSTFTDENGNPVEVPHDGTLGLLAMGHIGLIEWRKSKMKHQQKSTPKSPKGD